MCFSRTGSLIFVLLLTLCSPIPSRADGPFEPRADFEHIGRDRGLSHYSVFDVLQDRRGFLWFATRDGLDRFDGHDFRTFRARPGDAGALSSNRISCLLEDRHGTLWIGTDGGGVHRMDGEQETFETYLPQPSGIGGRANRVTALAEDGEGGMWVATFEGIYRLDPLSGRFSRLPGGPLGDDGDRAFAVAVDAEGALWLGSAAGLERVDQVAGARDALSLGPTASILPDLRNGLWVGTAEHGLVHIAERDADSWKQPESRQVVLPNVRVRDIAAGRGVLWVATEAGLVRYADDTGEVLTFRPDPLDPGALSYENVQAVLEDHSGIVWVATWGGGVDKLDGRLTSVSRARNDPNRAGSLSHNEVMAILEDRYGTIWVGTWRGGLNRLDPGADGFVAYRAAPGVRGALASDTITAIYEDRAGRLWIGTRGGGVHLFDRSSNSFQAFPQVAEPRARVHMIHAIAEDGEGRLFLGTSGGGLVRFDPETRSFETFDDEATPGLQLGDDDAWTLLPTEEGLWIGTSAGLRLMDWESGQFSAIRADVGDPSGLPEDRINCIYRDRAGRFWIATDGGGLARLERSAAGERSFHRYAEEDGLDSRLVKSLVEDASGRLWMGTDRGLSRLDPETGRVRNLGGGTGAQRGGYFENAATVGRDGRLYFGGFGGLTVLSGTELGDAPPPPRVVLTSFLLDNRQVPVSTPTRPTPLVRPVHQGGEIVIQHDQFPLAFEFAVLQFSEPAQQRFTYRLDGLDQKWITADAAHRRATYSGLAPGRYRFRVRGANAEGVWSEEEASVGLVVRAPWWLTWWARGGVAALFVGLVFLALRARLRRSEQARNVLERRVAERTAELEKLVELTERINGAITVEEVLDHAYDSFRTVAPYDRIGLALLDESRVVLRAVWTKGQREATGIGQGYQAPLAGSSLEEVLASGEPRIISDLEAYLAEHPESESTRRILSEGIRSSLTCPLTALGQPVGFIFLSSFEPNTYTAQHADFLKKIAGHLSLIVGKSRLYDDLLATKEQLERANRELESLARSDGLTGLANRRAFQHRIEADWSRCARAASPLSCLMIDVDQFKAYNDLYGHAAGDGCLRDVAEVLRNCIHRSSDLAARYGGEEFSVLLFGCPETAAVEIAERIRSEVERLGLSHAGSQPAGVVTVSVGCATQIPAAGSTPDDLLRSADQALYAAKRAGRNRVERTPNDEV